MGAVVGGLPGGVDDYTDGRRRSVGCAWKAVVGGAAVERTPKYLPCVGCGSAASV